MTAVPFAKMYTPETKELIYKLYEEDYTRDEIARIIGGTRNGVSRALNKLIPYKTYEDRVKSEEDSLHNLYKSRAPKGAQYISNGLYYKIDFNNRVFRWSTHGEWIVSAYKQHEVRNFRRV